MTAYTVDRESDTPLYIQIRDNITKAIDSGSLLPGDKLPSVSSLAKEIGVTQATIRRALQDLGKAGHTDCHVGRGTFITDANAPSNNDTTGDTPQTESNRDRQQKAHLAVSNPREFAARRLRSGVSKALYDIMPLAHKPGIIQLTKGIPDPNLLPDNFIEEITQDALKDGSKKYIQEAGTEAGSFSCLWHFFISFYSSQSCYQQSQAGKELVRGDRSVNCRCPFWFYRLGSVPVAGPDTAPILSIPWSSDVL